MFSPPSVLHKINTQHSKKKFVRERLVSNCLSKTMKVAIYINCKLVDIDIWIQL